MKRTDFRVVVDTDLEAFREVVDETRRITRDEAEARLGLVRDEVLEEEDRARRLITPTLFDHLEEDPFGVI